MEVLENVLLFVLLQRRMSVPLMTCQWREVKRGTENPKSVLFPLDTHTCTSSANDCPHEIARVKWFLGLICIL